MLLPLNVDISSQCCLCNAHLYNWFVFDIGYNSDIVNLFCLFVCRVLVSVVVRSVLSETRYHPRIEQ